MNEKQDVKEIDIWQLVTDALKKWWIVLISAVLCGSITFCGAKMFITPVYTASIKMYVNNSSAVEGSQTVTISSGDISAAKTLVNAFSVILKARMTIEDVIAESGVNYSYEKMASMISSSAINNTEVLEVKVKSTNKEEACKIANTIADVLPKKIASIVEGGSVNVFDHAVVPSSPSYPNYKSMASTGALIGAAVALVLILIYYYFNDVIKSEETLRSMFGEEVPILGVIPDVNEKGNGKYGKYGGYYLKTPETDKEKGGKRK